MTERIRLTISVTPEVHAIFTKMAEAAGVSLGKCMGDWLADTAEGAEFVAQKVVEARQAPMSVMRQFQGLARGLLEEVDSAAEVLGKAQRTSARQTAGQAELPGVRARRGAEGPPSSPTGVNPPQKARKRA